MLDAQLATLKVHITSNSKRSNTSSEFEEEIKQLENQFQDYRRTNSTIIG